MARVIFEWVGANLEPPIFTDDLSLWLEFPHWDDPLPRVGDSLSPPSGPMNVRGQDNDDYDWIVSSVTWLLTSDDESAWLEFIRIVVHETRLND
jgi:hypothetical protein